MSAKRPQYYENTLEPVKINREGLSTVLKELQSAVKHGVDLIQRGCPPADPADYGSIYSGTPGKFPVNLRHKSNLSGQTLNQLMMQVLRSHSYVWSARPQLSLPKMQLHSMTSASLPAKGFSQKGRRRIFNPDVSHPWNHLTLVPLFFVS